MQKSINEIVEELRANGELDEEKWTELEQEIRKKKHLVYSISGILLALAITKMEPLGILLTGGISYYLYIGLRKELQESKILTNLFSYGTTCKASAGDIVARFPFGTKRFVVGDKEEKKWFDKPLANFEIKSTLSIGG